MARRDALLRLHKQLTAQKEALLRKLAGDEFELADHASGHGDLFDAAVDEIEREVTSQLASLESRELARIQKAMEAIREGRYGICEVCNRNIPMARLQAVPHATSCVLCARNVESRGRRPGKEEDWESAWTYQERQSDHDWSMKDFVME